LALALGAILIAGCKKEEPATETPTATVDTTPPVITLTGKSNDTIALQTAYSDPGATVIDETDGSINTALNTTSTVNTALTGNYTLTYNAKDAAGNQAVTKTRKVRVQNTAEFLTGSYNVACTCMAVIPGDTSTTITTDNYSANATVSSSVNTVFTLSASKIGPVNVVPVTSLNGNTVNVT